MLSSLFPHRKFIRLDGGMGSMLQKGGMPVGALPEVYNITEPERIIDAQKQFVAVGSDIIYANTFGANRHKMAKSGYSVQELIAAGIACASFYVELGVKRENIFMFDSRGLIYKGRDHLNKWKEKFAQPTNCGDLAACMKDADMFLGLSKKGLVSKDMVRSMAHQPVIFAMANPDPEITYEDAKEARPEAIMGTGRSDYPNQINNVSGFPYIFRGALDVHATDINEAMKLAAAHALADLAKEPVPQEVLDAYNMDEAPEFGPDYVLPKPLDSRILTTVTPAVAKAAMESGVAQTPITDFKAYTEGLKKRMEAYHARVAPYVKQLADSMK